STKEKSRRLISRIVNLLSTKLELGSPIISLYLLNNPDHLLRSCTPCNRARGHTVSKCGIRMGQ
ncbi:MAG: hypothetical protein NXY57DRAFT_905602, partial [Lentinula lateritia]